MKQNQEVTVKYNRVEVFGDESEIYTTNNRSRFTATNNYCTLIDKHGMKYTKECNDIYMRKNSDEHGIQIISMTSMMSLHSKDVYAIKKKEYKIWILEQKLELLNDSQEFRKQMKWFNNLK